LRTNDSGEKMTHAEAMRILDKVKDGVPYPIKIIRMALELTGDLQQT